jgi:hypothetical protein
MASTREDYEQRQSMLDAPLGLGHPDTHGHYPGDSDEQYCKLCNPAAVNVKHATPSVYRQKHWSEEKSYIVLPARPAREWGDNDASSPEEAGWYGKGE